MFSEKFRKEEGKILKVEASNICSTANTDRRLVLNKIKIKIYSKGL